MTKPKYLNSCPNCGVTNNYTDKPTLDYLCGPCRGGQDRRDQQEALRQRQFLLHRVDLDDVFRAEVMPK